MEGSARLRMLVVESLPTCWQVTSVYLKRLVGYGLVGETETREGKSTSHATAGHYAQLAPRARWPAEIRGSIGLFIGYFNGYFKRK